MPCFIEIPDAARSAGHESKRICFWKTREGAASFLEVGIKIRVGQVAIATLCGLWLVAVSGAQASSVEITGSPFGAGVFPGYGSSVGKNNVVGYSPSGITDTTGGAGWLVGGSVSANVETFAVDWYFNGAESGDRIRFEATSTKGKSVVFTERNQNNNHDWGNDKGWWKLGTTTGKGDPIPFSLTDLDSKQSGPFIASLMLAYVDPVYETVGKGKRAHKILTGWIVTTGKTDWFAFGFNDPGATDRDYDDFMGIGHLRAIAGPPVAPTPVPGALILMGTVLGGGYVAGRWRRRQARKVRVAVA